MMGSRLRRGCGAGECSLLLLTRIGSQLLEISVTSQPAQLCPQLLARTSLRARGPQKGRLKAQPWNSHGIAVAEGLCTQNGLRPSFHRMQGTSGDLKFLWILEAGMPTAQHKSSAPRAKEVRYPEVQPQRKGLFSLTPSIR